MAQQETSKLTFKKVEKKQISYTSVEAQPTRNVSTGKQNSTQSSTINLMPTNDDKVNTELIYARKISGLPTIAPASLLNELPQPSL